MPRITSGAPTGVVADDYNAEPTLTLATAFVASPAHLIPVRFGRSTYPSSVVIIRRPKTSLAAAITVVFVDGSRLSMDGLVWGALAGLVGGITPPLAPLSHPSPLLAGRSESSSPRNVIDVCGRFVGRRRSSWGERYVGGTFRPGRDGAVNPARDHAGGATGADPGQNHGPVAVVANPPRGWTCSSDRGRMGGAI